MNRIRFNIAQDEKRIKKVEDIARIVWSQHYAQILDQGQIDFMLEKYQSAEAIERQIQQDGYAYYIISSDGEECGYFAFTMDKETLFLSKIYVMENFRKQGIASQVINFLCKICIENNSNKPEDGERIIIKIMRDQYRLISIWGFKKYAPRQRILEKAM